MSRATQVLQWAPAGLSAQIEFDEDGNLVQFALPPRGAPGPGRAPLAYLSGLGVESVRIDGVDHAAEVVRAELDVDEVDQRGEAGPLAVRVRHNLDSSWRVRIAVRNGAAETVTIDRLVLAVHAGDDARLQLHAAGALTMVTALPTQVGSGGGMPLLNLRLQRGELAVRDNQLVAEKLVLAPGEGYVLSFSGQVFDSPHEIEASYPAWFPPSLDLACGDRLAITHPDGAVTGTDVEATTEDGVPTFAPESGSGTAVVNVADPTGVSRLDVSWESPLPHELARTAAAVVSTGQATSDAEALVVLTAGRRQLIPAADADRVLDDYRDRPSRQLTPLRVSLWARRHASWGDADDLTAALDAFDEVPVQSGVGFAVLDLWAALRQRQPSQRDQDRLQEGLARVSAADQGPVALELATVMGPGAGRLAELSAMLGAGLPGRPWPPVGGTELAHRAALLQYGGQLVGQEEFGAPIVERITRRVLAALHEEPDALRNAPPLAWLCFTE